MPWKFPPLYPILDAAFLPAFERGAYLMRTVCDLEEAGVSLLQYRNKLATSDIPHDAKVMKGGATARMKLIMNDNPELAVNEGFDGVHVGQEDLSPVNARRVIGEGRILGISTHNRAQLEAAAQMPVDYISVGPVFSTSSKMNPDPVVGLEGIREARRLTTKTLVAIGGITLENARAILDAGADSVAVIAAIFGQEKEPARVAHEFLTMLGQ